MDAAVDAALTRNCSPASLSHVPLAQIRGSVLAIRSISAAASAMCLPSAASVSGSPGTGSASLSGHQSWLTDASRHPR